MPAPRRPDLLLPVSRRPAPIFFSEAATMDGLDEQEHTVPIPSDAAELHDLQNEAAGQPPKLMHQAQAMDLDNEPMKMGAAEEVASDHGQHNSSCPSGYKKKIRRGKGSDVRVEPPREFRAVEMALRNSPGRATVHIFEPVISTSFDSLGEAYEFYNLYSWEVGFGIRYGTSYSNGEGYHSTKELVCQMEGIDRRTENDSARCSCKAMIRLHWSDDHGWFVAVHRADHNHPLSDNCALLQFDARYGEEVVGENIVVAGLPMDAMDVALAQGDANSVAGYEADDEGEEEVISALRVHLFDQGDGAADAPINLMQRRVGARLEY